MRDKRFAGTWLALALTPLLLLGRAEARPEVLLIPAGGVGLGWSSGAPEVNIEDATGQPLSASVRRVRSFQLSPLLAVAVAPRWAFALQPRLQLVADTTDVVSSVCRDERCSANDSAFALFAKGLRTFGDQPIRPFLSAGIGVGTIRHRVSLGTLLSDCGLSRNQPCVDTLAHGPVLLSVGGGAFVKLGGRLSLFVEIEALTAIPSLPVQGELHAGLAVRL